MTTATMKGFMIERYIWDGCEITGTSFETLGEALEFEALVAADSCRPYMLFDARGVKLFEVTAAMLAKPVAELRIIGRSLNRGRRTRRTSN
jgi:hypothetical protein